MKNLFFWVGACITITLGMVLFAAAQTSPDASGAPHANLTADYPRQQAGVMIQSQSADWSPLAGAVPSKTRAKHGIAASLSYGAVPATIVAEYEGLHAQTEIAPGQPVICLCHLVSLPGDPVLVRLHPKKASRELDGGRMIVYPVVGGSKMADANKSDLVPVDVSQPESMVWLVRPQQPLEPGEYALMLGTQNMNIFPFTVKAPATPAPQSEAK